MRCFYLEIKQQIDEKFLVDILTAKNLTVERCLIHKQTIEKHLKSERLSKEHDEETRQKMEDNLNDLLKE